MAYCDEGATLRVDAQSDIGAGNPTTVQTTRSLERAIAQGSPVHGPIDTGRRIRGRRHTAELH